MNAKKANWAFLISVVLFLGMQILIVKCVPALAENLFLSNLIAELAMLLPFLALLFTSQKEQLAGQSRSDFLGFHKLKISSVLMIILFTMFSSPTMALINLISQLWVKNEAVQMIQGYQVEQMPFGLFFISLAVVAPLCEETLCRGGYYHAYGKSGSACKGMLLSALLFAVIHMNFNQAAYAAFMGIMAVLLVEATGSLWASVFYHALINGSQSILIYGILRTGSTALDSAADMVTTDFMFYAIGVYAVISAITLPLAWAILVWLSGNEGRRGILPQIWENRKEKKDKLLTIPLVLGLILCFAVMLLSI